MSDHVSMKVNTGAMQKLHEALAGGVGELAHEVVRRAEGRKPKASVARVVVLIDGRVLEGDSAGITAAAGHQLEAFAVFTAPALLVEIGTGSHEIKPRDKQALKLAGDKGFATVVHHPGTKPNPFINPALVAVASSPEAALKAGVAKRWSG